MTAKNNRAARAKSPSSTMLPDSHVPSPGSSVLGRVSIGIPAYKRPDPLRRILKIACEQTYRNLEIIVSDDASPDDRVKKIVQEYAAGDSRIIYHRQEKNLGVLANAEFVLRQSTGEFFTLFSEDDWRSQDFIATLVDELEKKPTVAAAFCDYADVYEDGSRAPGYPASHLPVFRPFENPVRIARVLSYYWQDPRRSQRAFFYSVFRRSAIAALDWKALSGGYTRLNMDDLLVFTLLQRSAFVVNEKLMCTLTCGNTKHYEDPLRSRNPRAPRISRLGVYLQERATDLSLYVRSTDSGIEKSLMCALFLPKVVKDAVSRVWNGTLYRPTESLATLPR